MDNERKISKVVEFQSLAGAFDRMVLADGVISTFDSLETGLNNNVMVLGATGTGKSMSITEPQIISSHKNSLVVTVVKRKVADQYEMLLRSRGYDVQFIDLVNPGRSSVRFDPLDYLMEDSDIFDLAKAIVSTDKKDIRDAYWEESSAALIAAEIAALKEMWDTAVAEGAKEQNYDTEPTLENLLSLHEKLTFVGANSLGLTISSLDALFEEIGRKNPKSLAFRYWNSIKKLPPKTVSCIKSTADVAYNHMFTPRLQKQASLKYNLDPFKLGTQRTALFIIASPIEESSQRFTNMIYATIFRFLFRYAENQKDYRLPVPVHFLCDDFASGATIPNFASYISTMRATGISATILVQSESQLKTLYGDADAATIRNNCDRIVYMGGMDMDTCMGVAQRANVPLEAVLGMPREMVYVFERGKKAKYAKRYQTMEDPVWVMMKACERELS